MNPYSLPLGYVYTRFLRLIALTFFLAGIGFLYIFFGTSELMALAFVLMISGSYVFTVKTIIELKEGKFRITTNTFYFLNSGKWISKSAYPLTSLKSVQKTYEMPRAFAILNQGSAFVKDMDQRVVLTDEFQRRFINLKDFDTLKKATDFINEVNIFLGTEFAMWGTKMKR